MSKTHMTYDKVDLTGQKENRLTAIKRIEGSRSRWLCKCDCGNMVELYASRFIKQITKSCGCFEKENRKNLNKRFLKHGMTDTILYEKWCGIKYRCYNPGYKYYLRYGGRGISVCNEWLGEHGFENFMKWAYDAGYDDSKKTYEQTLDRIDLDGNYCPENCRWVNQVEQVKNRCISRLITDIDGEKLTSVQFDKKHNIHADMFTYRRMRKGYSAQQILDEWKVYEDYENGKYFLKSEAAKNYNVCISTIDRWIEKGLIKYVKSRNKILIPKEQNRPVFN